MNNVKKVNRVFLLVVVATIAASFVAGILTSFTDSIVLQLLTNQILLFLPAGIYIAVSPEGITETIGLRKIPLVTVPMLILEMVLAYFATRMEWPLVY